MSKKNLGPNLQRVSSARNVSYNTDRPLLSQYRVLQRDLVYVVGIPLDIANEETLRKYEYFGQYGPIKKIVINNSSMHALPYQTVSAYVTFENIEDAWECIYALSHYQYEDRYPLRPSFGTSKYCSAFLNGQKCKKPECMYMHSEGSQEDSFSIEEIQQNSERFNEMTKPRLPKDYFDYQFKDNPPTIFPPRRILSSGPKSQIEENEEPKREVDQVNPIKNNFIKSLRSNPLVIQPIKIDFSLNQSLETQLSLDRTSIRSLFANSISAKQ